MRGESQKKIVISTIFMYSLINAFLFYFIYFLYLNIGCIITGLKMSNIPRNTFDGLFGQGFCNNHTYLYYLMEGIPSYFIGSFIYTIMACTISLFCKKMYQTIIAMLTYFWSMQIILQLFRKLFGNYLAYVIGKFEPTYLFGYYGYVYPNPSIITVVQTMSSLLIPIVASIILLILSLRSKEKLYE